MVSGLTVPAGEVNVLNKHKSFSTVDVYIPTEDLAKEEGLSQSNWDRGWESAFLAGIQMLLRH